MTDKIRALAASISARKESGAEPFVLLIGAGASVGSGCSPMSRLVDDVLQDYDRTRFEEWQASVEKAASISAEFGALKAKEVARLKLDGFYETWVKLDNNTRLSILKRHLWEGKAPSPGYEDLARLVAAGYFKVALSTNLDNLLESALNLAGWREPDNFVVAVNGKDTPEEVRYQLESAHAPFKLVKLHGTLASPLSYAFTPEEIFKFEETIKPELARYLNRSLLVVGHSLQDRDIDVLFEKEGGEIHYVNPAPPEPGGRIDNVLKVRGYGSRITGEEARFDDFFRLLRGYLEAPEATAADKSSGPSIEGFLKSIGYEHELKATHSRFKNLPTLYVKPSEYEAIRRKLEREHVVFIIGEPHLGKTYTAFHLLWEYYREGYEPLHIRHDRLVSLLQKHDGDLRKILAELFVGEGNAPRVVHFDDPFGETMERRTDRTNVFARELETFLKLAREYERVRVVVTTRLNIFREAVGETHGVVKLDELEKSIRVHTSYLRETLLDILHRYTKFYGPRWASDARIVAALDEQLPGLLPAPHNIEFFVRTSEALTTLEEVLRHVEESKEMVKALADWMGFLPAPEQVFLLLVEVAASSAILFPGTNAAAIDVEAAYMEMLAYLFKRKHLPGIPTSSFENARAKFDLILVERRDAAGLIRFDFVHPSYHEAFWHAIRQNHPLARWWVVMQTDLQDIFKDFENRPDLVQLRMIERYGTIDRDLDRLLLISADSDDVEEQIIAFEHMLDRPEKFAHLPQFSRCLSSITSTDNEWVKRGFLRLVNERFDRLPLTVMDAASFLLFDNNEIVRAVAEGVTRRHLTGEHSPVKNNERLRAWDFFSKFMETYRGYTRRYSDLVTLIEIITGKPAEIGRLSLILMELHLEDFKFFVKVDYHPILVSLVKKLVGAFPFNQLPENKLEFLLSCQGFIQYETLTNMLRRYESLSGKRRVLVDSLVSTPQEPWIGGTIGRAATIVNWNRVVSSLVVRTAKDGSKEVVGALLAEMADEARQAPLDRRYDDPFSQLIKDAVVVRHAITWIDHKRATFPDFDASDADALKSYLLNQHAESKSKS